MLLILIVFLLGIGVYLYNIKCVCYNNIFVFIYNCNRCVLIILLNEIVLESLSD